MRLGVISEGDSLDSFVAEDFGHAPFFLIVDADTLDFQVIENEFAREMGAGMKVATAISGMDIEAVITGGIGHHGIEILQKAGIRVVSDEEGTVEECVRDYIRRQSLKI